MATFASVIDQVESLYVGYFGRAGDPSGTQSWTQAVSTGKVTINSVAALFATSPEAQGKYPYLAAPQVADPTQFVGQVYQNLFNRIPDQAGLTFWVNYLNQNKGNPTAVGTFISTVISSAQGVDGTTITNKVRVATDFTQKVTDAGTTFGAQTAAQSTTEIQAVNDTEASVTAAKAATTTYIAQAPGPEQTFTTVIGETLTSSDTNANFMAPLVLVPGIGTVQTLQSGDSALATGTGATLTATLNGAAATNVTISGIPTVNLTETALGLTPGSVVSGNITGVTTLNVNNSTAGASPTTFGAAGAGGGLNTALKTVTYKDSGTANVTAIVSAAALTAADNALTLNFKSLTGTNAAPVSVVVKTDTATAGTATNAYERITVKADAATFVRLSDAGSGALSTKQIDVTGTGTAALFGFAAENFKNVTTIDATASGGATITGATSAGGLLSGNTVLSSFKGGAGADSLDVSNMTAAQLQAFTAGNLDGGSGGVDTLIVGTGAATGLTGNVNNSGFDTLSISALSGTVDFGKFGSGITTVSLVNTMPQAGNATFNNVASGVTFALSDKHGGFNETFNAAGTGLTDSLLITHTAGTAVGTITATGFETVTETLATNLALTTIAGISASASPGANVTYNFVDNSAGAVAITTINVGVGGTFNISGTGNGGVTLGAVTAGALNASTAASGVNMTVGASGQISILGSAQADTLRGSGVADSISGNGGNDVVAPGLGGDVVAGGAGVDTFTSTVGGNNFAAAGQGVAATGQNLTAAIVVGETLVFGAGTIGSSNIDRVVDFVSGTDKLDVVNAGAPPTNFFGGNGNDVLANNSLSVLYGTYNNASGVFTVAQNFVAGASTDALVVQGNGATTFNNHTGTVVLTGLNQALGAADFG